MKKTVLLLFIIVLLLYAVANHKFLEAMAYLHDNNLANDTKAIALLNDAVQTDQDRKSAFLLGYYYKTAKYQNINMLKSHDNYLIASNMGDNKAKMIVAWNFYKGKGCTIDVKKAKDLLTQLAILGDTHAKEILKYVIRH